MVQKGGIKVALSRDFGGFRLAIDLELPSQGVSILFGPSGCGKTSLLRGIAGLDPDMKGHVSVNGDVWLDSSARRLVPTWQRSVGFVFQDAALFPHLKVRENLSYGMRRARAIAEGPGYDRVLELLDLGSLLERYPEKLSGGELQRVAIARALLSQPKLLLMDEPLSSLDAIRKREFIPYLERLNQELQIPVIYVTHAPDEVMQLADFVVLMAEEGVDGCGSLEEMLPRLAMTPGFGEESGTVISGVLGAHYPLDGVSEVRLSGGQLWVALQAQPEGSRVRCRIFPSDVSLSKHHPVLTSVLNVLPVLVQSVSERDDGGQILVGLNLYGTRLIASVTRKSARDLDLHPGQSLYALIKATTLSK